MPDCQGGYAPNNGLSWCHLSSADLVHWTEHELVLYPTDNATLDPCLPTVVDTGSISILPSGQVCGGGTRCAVCCVLCAVCCVRFAVCGVLCAEC